MSLYGGATNVSDNIKIYRAIEIFILCSLLIFVGIESFQLISRGFKLESKDGLELLRFLRLQFLCFFAYCVIRAFVIRSRNLFIIIIINFILSFVVYASRLAETNYDDVVKIFLAPVMPYVYLSDNFNKIYSFFIGLHARVLYCILYAICLYIIMRKSSLSNSSNVVNKFSYDFSFIKIKYINSIFMMVVVMYGALYYSHIQQSEIKITTKIDSKSNSNYEKLNDSIELARSKPLAAQEMELVNEYGTAATTIRAFYAALHDGQGEIASGLVVPEKRTIPAYMPTNLTRFYGGLAKPIELIGIAQTDGTTYSVRYTYSASSKVCNGEAIVTTAEREGRHYIQGIKALNGC